jgi:hypothetical protein
MHTGDPKDEQTCSKMSDPAPADKEISCWIAAAKAY